MNKRCGLMLGQYMFAPSPPLPVPVINIALKSRHFIAQTIDLLAPPGALIVMIGLDRSCFPISEIFTPSHASGNCIHISVVFSADHPSCKLLNKSGPKYNECKGCNICSPCAHRSHAHSMRTSYNICTPCTG